MNEHSACESCGQEFSCGAKLDGCWCSELTLTDEALEFLRQRFSGCLCRACLERISRQFDVNKGIVTILDRGAGA